MRYGQRKTSCPSDTTERSAVLSLVSEADRESTGQIDESVAKTYTWPCERASERAMKT